jgi:uncharacterized protein
LTNVRTILRSDWVDASDLARVVAYVVIVLIWAAATAYSIREYLADRRDIRVDTAAGPDASPVVSGPATRLR